MQQGELVQNTCRGAKLGGPRLGQWRSGPFTASNSSLALVISRTVECSLCSQDPWLGPATGRHKRLMKGEPNGGCAGCTQWVRLYVATRSRHGRRDDDSGTLFTGALSAFNQHPSRPKFRCTQTQNMVSIYLRPLIGTSPNTMTLYLGCVFFGLRDPRFLCGANRPLPSLSP
jgi:hypothetical protein